MAMPMIETGYKPEFGLGAVYQGFNAANADMSAQEELIKQFLANQREQNVQPIDIAQAQQNLDSTKYKTTPEYQTGMRDTISGQGMSNLAAGQTASALQPFMQKEKTRESQNAFERADQQNGIYQLDNLIQTEQNPLQRMALIKERERMTRNLRETPEFTGKREIKETGTDSAEYIAELRAAQAREAARLRASEQGAKPAKTFEEFIARILEKKAAGQELSPAEIEAWDNASGGFNAKNAAKIQPGTKLNLEKLPNVPLEEKPVQQQYAPSTSAPQSKSKLSPEERAAIIKKLTESK